MYSMLLSPEQIMVLLDGYEVIVTGMPVYAGELEDFYTSYSVGGTNYYAPHLALKP
ncbi:hypothetical protein ACP8HI_20205 [Paenibacillus sp. FA6]|uniref:hypothetical protein n=1 Tax=Paenibacillus sp. FA6 TaxID=3413029 RepID=UPI003F65B415